MTCSGSGRSPAWTRWPARRSSRRPARPTTTTSACSRWGRRPGRRRPVAATVGLYHLAWEVDTLDELARLRDLLTGADALVGASDHGTTKSLYGRDPDGLEFEIAWIIPADLLDDEAREARTRIGRLDLDRERARYGGNDPGRGGHLGRPPEGWSGGRSAVPVRADLLGPGRDIVAVGLVERGDQVAVVDTRR